MGERVDSIEKIQTENSEVTFLQFGLLNGRLQQQGMFLDGVDTWREVFLLWRQPIIVGRHCGKARGNGAGKELADGGEKRDLS